LAGWGDWENPWQETPGTPAPQPGTNDIGPRTNDETPNAERMMKSE
jgi:hypothetical protein